MKKAVFLPVLLASLPLVGIAQNTTQDSLLRQGDLVGGRPHASVPRTAATTRRATTATTAVTNADPVLVKMLHESVDISRVPASQINDLFERFLEATNDQRRQWSDRDWDEASATLTRLNARYEAVRLELPLTERVNVRRCQGEFHTLQSARRVKERLDK
ncbi:hypothetical protein GO988_03745 [Hymenobacter sp. HMF4947]|uniref:Uncharacterized protein n=1 Tax=Hymenobacter ginkgonis TaxID=2682976 RepID=A0A7K1TB57_9BACT|nr:hypothetical protein [Hymenobacter ginkgonis]MVN75431.1 hypothetical protein [Hymenobacter ginkgonis]